jgi:hypothetical protein
VILEDAVRGVGFPTGSVEAARTGLLEAGASFVTSDDLGTLP